MNCFSHLIQCIKGSSYVQDLSSDNLKVSAYAVKNLQLVGGQAQSALFFDLSARNSINERAPLNLVIIFDISSSMEDYFYTSKASIKYMCSQLRQQDKVALVTFDNSVDVYHFEKMNPEGMSRISTIVDSIPMCGSSVSGWINYKELRAAIFSGIELLLTKTQQNEPAIQSIMLLTNAYSQSKHLNQTTSIVAEIGKITCQLPALTIYTFGYGSFQNADLLRAISDVGSGMYYFVDSEEGIPKAFGSYLGGLLSTSVRRVSIQVNSPHVLECAQKCHQQLGIVTHRGKVITFEVGDLFDEENKDFLIQLEGKSQEENVLRTLKCRVDFLSVDSNRPRIIHVPVQILDIAEMSVLDEKIITSLARVCTAAAIEKAKDTARRGLLGIARNTINSAISEILNYRYSDLFPCLDVSVGCFIETLEECFQNLVSNDMFQTEGIKHLCSHAQRYWKQRHNQVKYGKEKSLTKQIYQNISSFAMQSLLESQMLEELKYCKPKPQLMSDGIGAVEENVIVSSAFEKESFRECSANCFVLQHEPKTFCPYFQGQCSFGNNHAAYAPF